MIRRSLSLIRTRQGPTGQLHPKVCYIGGGHHVVPAQPTITHSHVIPRTFYSDSANDRNASSNRKNDQYRNNNRFNNDRNRPGSRDGRRGNNNQNNNELTPSYISHLEQRAKEHIQSSSQLTDPTLIAPWHRTTVQQIMLMSKLWGKSYRAEPKQLVTFVSLANELLLMVLLLRKAELDNFFTKQRGYNDDDGVYEDETQKNKRQPRSKGAKGLLNTGILCQTVSLGLSRCDPKIAPDAAIKAQTILEELEDICSRRRQADNNTNNSQHKSLPLSFTSNDVTPSIQLYNHILSCWSRSLDPNAETHAKNILERMIEGSTAHSKPDVISYNNLLNLHANRGDVNAAKKLLNRMEDQPNDAISPDVYSYSIVMNAYQKRFTKSGPDERDMEDPERAEELLSHLVSRYDESGFQNAKLRPSMATFGTVISMYAQADRLRKEDDKRTTRNWKAKAIEHNIQGRNNVIGWGAANAERILDWIIGLSEREHQSKNIRTSTIDNPEKVRRDGRMNPNNEVIRANSHHFATVMDAWAKSSKGLEGARKCEALLNRHISLYEKQGYPDLEPNPVVFGAVIDAWAKADDKPQTAEHAESLLDRMEELFLKNKSSNRREMLTNIPYNLVIDAWSRRSGNGAAERAEHIFHRLNDNYQRTNNIFLRPDVFTYTALMKAYVDHPNGGKRALEILDEMNNQYRLGNAKARPDAQALSIAMDACAKNALTSEAERVLNDVEDSRKTNVMMNTIISGYKSEGRGTEAEAVLRRMIDLSEQGGWRRCSPDTLTYTLCIEAWNNSTSQDRVARVKSLVDELIARYRHGDRRCKPSNVTFIVTAECISKSDEPDRETQVLSLFENMEEFGCEPDRVCFNVLIKACATANGNEERKRNALTIAANSFNSMSSLGIKPDSITYTSMFQCMTRLMEDSAEKVEAISGIFQQCCNQGRLNQHMVNLLQSSFSEDEFKRITGASIPNGGQIPSIHTLPSEWSNHSSVDDSCHQSSLDSVVAH